MRKTYILKDGKLVEKKRLGRPGIEIIPDIKPYQSMITGERIRSRSHHKQHLRDHGCVEVGDQVDKHQNAYDNLSAAMDKQRHEVIQSQFADMPHKEFKQMIERSIKQARG